MLADELRHVKDREAQLMGILKIGHETSIRGEGISLAEALERTGYKSLRKTFAQNDLTAIILKHPEITSEWLAYSEDKRTGGGWYILAKGEIGQIDNPESIKHFDAIEEAVSEYVVRELDFWSTVKK
ncbi:MAG: hypothetical protein PVJ53_15950 [Desulfobacterales bacterium]|jgi:hypothetical protein